MNSVEYPLLNKYIPNPLSLILADWKISQKSHLLGLPTLLVDYIKSIE